MTVNYKSRVVLFEILLLSRICFRDDALSLVNADLRIFFKLHNIFI